MKSLITEFNDYRSNCINLIPSENTLSPNAKKALSSDYGSRYFFDDPFTTGNNIHYHYFGTQKIEELVRVTQNLSSELFKCKYSNIYPLSGHLANLSVLLAFCEKGDKIICTSPDNGGYPGLSYDKLPRYLDIETDYFPYNNKGIDYDLLNIMLRNNKYKLLFFSSAHTLFSEDVSLMRNVLDKYGTETKIVYDASHPLGLIAGGLFPNPLEQGADILLGSTQKSFPGPQGGIILTNNEKIHRQIDYSTHFVTLDNPHFHRIAALSVTIKEMLEHGNSYASQIILNSRKLASELDKRGISIMYSEKNFTETHQIKVKDIILHKSLAPKLEKANIIVDNAGRIGVNEMTRFGMKEKEMEQIANLILKVLNGKNLDVLRDEVIALRSQFQTVKYC